MNKVIHLVSLQRCGTHAIANWLLHQNENIKKLYVLKPEGNDTHFFYNNDNMNDELFVLFNNRFFFDARLGRRYEYKVEYLQKLTMSIIIYEIAEIYGFNTNYEDKHDILGDEFIEYNVLMLRDVLNCFASFFKLYGTVPAHIIPHWKARAEEWLGTTHYVPNKIKVNYNLWVTDQEYRKGIVTDLGLHFTDIGINYVTFFGNGSSFDGLTKQNNAQDMAVNDRWKQLLNNVDFRMIVRQNTNLIEMSEKIFGRYM